MNKNWPNDFRVGCKALSNLLELIGIDAHLEEELEQFERAFERDEIVDLLTTENIYKAYYFVKKIIIVFQKTK